MRERDVENHLVHRVRDAGGRCWKWTSPGVRGVPDRIVTLHGRVVFVELKAPGEKPSHQQERVHAQLRDQGCEVAVLDSKATVDTFVDNLIPERYTP
ncbi:MAG: VRR-NUC domain-containing protein [Chromatiaceae bacterium]|nr:VRR-NUC domain-containing protein [Chromatiaceae bacterium]